jgi:predicted TIM-barrel fold metal-dependent hydrolase
VEAVLALIVAGCGGASTGTAAASSAPVSAGAGGGATAAATAAGSTATAGGGGGAEKRFFKIDVHTHFGPAAVERMVRLMDGHGIDVAVNLSGGSPERGLPEQLAAARAHPGRVVVFANLDWRLARTGPGWGARMADDLERSRRLGAVGLKIPKGLGLGYVDYTGALVRVDDPELDVVFERAATLAMPVAIHTGDPVAFWAPPTPDNERYEELSAHPEWSFYGAAVPSWEELFESLERRIARHPRTTFISVHFGNAPEDPPRVAALLDRYPNLYVDTAARIPEIGRHPSAALRALFLAHEDRILFGTDLAVGATEDDVILGSSGREPPTPADIERFFASTWRFFETRDAGFPHPTPIQGRWTISGIGLPAAALRKVYGLNAARLLALPAPPP